MRTEGEYWGWVYIREVSKEGESGDERLTREKGRNIEREGEKHRENESEKQR